MDHCQFGRGRYEAIEAKACACQQFAVFIRDAFLSSCQHQQDEIT